MGNPDPRQTARRQKSEVIERLIRQQLFTLLAPTNMGISGIRNSPVLWLAQHRAELWSNKVRKYDGQGSNSERAESSTQLLDYHILTQHELAQPVQWTRVPISSRLSGETRVAMPLLAWEQCLYDLQQVMICKCIQRIAL